MGWNASLSASSALGSAITFTPDTTTEGTYTVAAFTAPKKAIYRFLLKGSGGTVTNNGGSSSAGGTGGTTTGYLLLEAGQKVYVGAGGPCSAAFVSKVTGSKLSSIAKENLYFVAGGGGGGGYSNENDTSRHGGRGGDGLYGGKGGTVSAGGGGGSGYVYSAELSVGSKTFASSTAQGGGAGSHSAGSVVVTYYADAELPVSFDGVKLMELFFNGTRVEHLVYNGAALFMHTLKRGVAALLSMLRESPRLKEAVV